MRVCFQSVWYVTKPVNMSQPKTSDLQICLNVHYVIKTMWPKMACSDVIREDIPIGHMTIRWSFSNPCFFFFPWFFENSSWNESTNFTLWRTIELDLKAWQFEMIFCSPTWRILRVPFEQGLGGTKGLRESPSYVPCSDKWALNKVTEAYVLQWAWPGMA